MPGVADLFAAQAPASQPVMNAPNALMQQQQEQAQNQQRQAMTAATAQDIQAKQRSMQLSGLGGLLSLPPDKYAALAPTVINSMNKLNPSMQIKSDADIDMVR